MTRRPLPQKNLVNMPNAVRWSAWIWVDNPGIAARVMRGLDRVLELCVRLTCWAAWVVTVGAVGGMLLWPVIGAKTVPTDLHLPGAFYWAALVLFGLAQRIKVALLIPRADREYPLVDDFGQLDTAFRLLGLQSLACTACLWWTLTRIPVANLPGPLLAAATVSLASIGFWIYYLIPPLWGARAPSREELAARQSALRTPSSAEAARDEDYVTPVELSRPTLKFADIFGMEEAKQRLYEAAEECRSRRARAGEPPRNGILLHGAPGNGKTVFAEALAGELQVPIVKLTYGAVASKWKSETPRLLAKSFAFARQNAPCVLFIDEVDSLIRQRDSSWHIEDVKTVNTLLTEIVDLRQHPVILIAATNFLDSLDQAAIREGRFDFKVEVPPPDLVARKGILTAAASKAVPALALDGAALDRVAARWDGFSVSRLVAIARVLPEVVSGGRRTVLDNHWLAALRSVQGNRRRARQDVKRLEDLVLPSGTQEALQLLADRLRHATEAEALGATTPRGALFYGPPGTGKTVSAQALAVSSDWAFLPVAGPDLLSEPGRLFKVLEEAADLRPAVVFIDEADDVLRSRAVNPRPDMVNRLLALMDGVGPLPRDVLLIAATNHPDQVDEALLRAGRFTEKVEFDVPDVDGVALAIHQWLGRKSVEAASGLVPWLAGQLAGESVAVVEGVLQYALNRSALRRVRGQTDSRLNEDDFRAGLEVVAGRRRGA